MAFYIQNIVKGKADDHYDIDPETAKYLTKPSISRLSNEGFNRDYLCRKNQHISGCARTILVILAMELWFSLLQ
jgi:hypothetical protein